MNKPHSEESKAKMSKNRSGKPAWNKGKVGCYKVSEATKNKIRATLSGKKRPLEVVQKMSVSHKQRVADGKCHLYKGGTTSINLKIRLSLECRLWRTAVFERDNYTCVWCGKVGTRLNADHIKPFAHYPELRFAIDNGRTLCEPCHRTTDTYGRRSVSTIY